MAELSEKVHPFKMTEADETQKPPPVIVAVLDDIVHLVSVTVEV